jgi:DNA excision repair protein ERCC-2
MITGYDPASRTLTTGIGNLLGFGRLPESLIPSDNPLNILARQRVHSAFQREKIKSGWQMEVPVKLELEIEGITFRIRGRIDLVNGSGNPVELLEVKTLLAKPDFEDPVRSRTDNALQLYFYAKSLAAEKSIPLDCISASLVFLSMDSDEPGVHSYQLCLSDEELEKSWSNLLREVAGYLAAEDARKEFQAASVERFTFPYESLRPGQQKILQDVGACIDSEGYLLLQAPTGTGKTAAVLAGAIRHTLQSRLFLFFLTAKNTHKLIVRETLERIIENGVSLRGIFITAKSSICHRGRQRCFPDDCPFAMEFAARVRSSGIIGDLLDHSIITPELLKEKAEDAGVCAFELGLCLATECDIITCDYNYVFDPHVFLKRFFLESTTSRICSLLIDEAANLPSRAIDYYSPEMRFSWITELLSDPGCTATRKKLLKPWKEAFREWKPLIETKGSNEIELPADTELPLNVEGWIRHITDLRDPPESLREVLRAVIDFSRISGGSDERYHLLIRYENGEYILQWFCTDPSEFLQERLENCHSAVAFSATLAPFDHFRYLLGFPDGKLTRTTEVEWPFPKENLGVWINPEIDTRYRHRSSSASLLVQRVSEIYAAVPGTWLLILPSYAYLEIISDLLEDSGIPLLIQTPGMMHEDRTAFIESMESDEQLVLIVSGGVFSEGIDLRSDSLRGAIIVGPSLPGMNLRMKLLSESYSLRGKDAFIHTWAVPGMVRVIQAAGRLVRNRTERKALVLIGKRFTKYPYFGLLPPHWFKEGSIPLISGGFQRISEFFDKEKGGAETPPS